MFKKINGESGLFHAKAQSREEYHRYAINQFFVLEGTLVQKVLGNRFQFWKLWIRLRSARFDAPGITSDININPQDISRTKNR
jgi:hypothetical protein